MSVSPAIPTATTQRRRHSRPHRRLTALFALLGATITAALIALPAGAADYAYCHTIISPYGHCDGPRHSLTANQAYDNYGTERVCAGAADTSGGFYGSYACGYSFAEHCYSGSVLLYPRIHNGESFAQEMHGHAFYSVNCP